ncbi:tail fiber assembly protein [Enterobacter asburiae]|uniref:tail fiber assembly protein n=1 Tax=Enterobacter asburiae TaxID=61645 RepID=UPI003BD764DA
MIAGKFTQYIPTDEKLQNDADIIKKNTGLDVIFLRDKDGNDWYDIQSGFDPAKIKIMYDDNGIIRSYSSDASSLNPIDSFVAEVTTEDFPSGINILGGWRFDGEKIMPVDIDIVAENEAKKQRLIAEAAGVIAPLQDAVDLSMATGQETANLHNWKRYRVLLNRVDPNEPDWPLKPTL